MLLVRLLFFLPGLQLFSVLLGKFGGQHSWMLLRLVENTVLAISSMSGATIY